MAECDEDIVYRKVDPGASGPAAVANDDGALIKAYEEAVKSCQPFSNHGTLKEEDIKKEGLLESEEKSNESDDWKTAVEWTLGSRCRAVWSGDGLVYPAVLVWRKGDRGRVCFEGYGNEEELDLSTLLPPEVPEECVTTVAKQAEKDPDVSGSFGLRKTEMKPPTCMEDSSNSLPSSYTTGRNGDWSREHSDDGKERGNRASAEGGRDGQEDSAPQMGRPPPYLTAVPPLSEASVPIMPTPPFLPPPPPNVWPLRGRPGGGDDGRDSDMATLSSMLLSWYLCGYHTGYYTALQRTGVGQDRAAGDKGRAKPRQGKHEA